MADDSSGSAGRMRRVHGRRSSPDLLLFGVTVFQQFVREQIWSGHADVLDVEAEMLRSLRGEARLGALRHHARMPRC